MPMNRYARTPIIAFAAVLAGACEGDLGHWGRSGTAAQGAEVARSGAPHLLTLQDYIDVAGSTVPASLAPGETGQVSIRVVNTGDETWSEGAMIRLASAFEFPANEVDWVGFPCGGYERDGNPLDARVYICGSVEPGQDYYFNFTIQMPFSASGSATLGVLMVQDWVTFFGPTERWTIAVGGGGGPTLPDVVITDLVATPSNPSVGQAVQVVATVRNVGNAPTPSGPDKVIGVGFHMDDGFFGWGIRSTPLAAGASATIALDAGPSGGTWRPAYPGVIGIHAMVDDINRFAELDEANNTRDTSVTVGGGGPGPTPGGSFVSTSGTSFVVGGAAHRFIGANMRGLVHYGDTAIYPYSTPQDAETQLNDAQAMGAGVVRAFVPHHDIDVNEATNRLCRTLDVARRHNIRLILAMIDYYSATGLYPPGDGDKYSGGYLSHEFFNSQYTQNYLPYARALAQRFQGDPAIFSWELGNEIKDPADMDGFITFADDASKALRAVDAHHLISVGSQGGQDGALRLAPDLARRLYSLRNINFLTMHPYVAGTSDGHQDDDTPTAFLVQKPSVVEEAGYEAESCAPRGGRAACASQEMDYFFGRGSQGHMPWGFVGPSTPPYDGDSVVGMSWTDSDWSELFSTYQQRANGFGSMPEVGGASPCTQGMAIQQGQTIAFSYRVPSGQGSLSTTTSWPGGDIFTTLVSPSGRTFSRGTSAPDVDHTVRPTVELFTIEDPEPGFWVVKLDGAEVAPGGEEVMFSASTNLPVPPDITAPVITPRVTGTLGDEGWYTSEVQVDFEVSDPESGVVSFQGCDSVTLSQDSAGMTLTCRATNGDGLTSERSVTVKIDRTPPAISIQSPLAQDYVRTDSLTARWTATDALSGLKGTSAALDGAPVANGQTLDLSTLSLGTHELVVRAQDRAGNVSTRSVTFRVVATIESLISLLESACSAGTIPHGTCTSLLAKLEAARASRDRGQTGAERNQLEAFVHELDAVHGRLPDGLYALLRGDALWVIAAIL